MVFWYILYYHENIGYDAWRQLKTLCHCQKDSTWWKRSCFITKVFFVIRYRWNNPIKTLYLHMSNVFISLLTMCIYRRVVRQNVSHVWFSVRIKIFLQEIYCYRDACRIEKQICALWCISSYIWQIKALHKLIECSKTYDFWVGKICYIGIPIQLYLRHFLILYYLHEFGWAIVNLAIWPNGIASNCTVLSASFRLFMCLKV